MLFSSMLALIGTCFGILLLAIILVAVFAAIQSMREPEEVNPEMDRLIFNASVMLMDARSTK